MREKTIKSVITKKVNEWLISLKEYLVEQGKEEREIDGIIHRVKRDLIITGGSIVSLMDNETPKDYDVYFKTKETVIEVAQMYVDMWNNSHNEQSNGLGIKTKVFVLDGANPSEELLEYHHIDSLDKSQSRMIANTSSDRVKIIFPSDGIVGDPEDAGNSEELGEPIENLTEVDEVDAEDIEEKENRRYFPVFLSTNAITLSDGIQIVARFYGEPKDIHETYDFVHTKGYFDVGNNELYIPKEVYEAVHNKVLIYTGSKYPVCSLFRMRKFIKRGWKINAGQILKIAMQISELDLTNIDVLEEQLIGVDSLYFMQLIEQFRRQKEKDPNFDLTSNYVMSVVDKIF